METQEHTLLTALKSWISAIATQKHWIIADLHIHFAAADFLDEHLDDLYDIPIKHWPKVVGIEYDGDQLIITWLKTN